MALVCNDKIQGGQGIKRGMTLQKEGGPETADQISSDRMFRGVRLTQNYGINRMEHRYLLIWT
jgi:hypothetical protein